MSKGGEVKEKSEENEKNPDPGILTRFPVDPGILTLQETHTREAEFRVPVIEHIKYTRERRGPRLWSRPHPGLPTATHTHLVGVVTTAGAG